MDHFLHLEATLLFSAQRLLQHICQLKVRGIGSFKEKCHVFITILFWILLIVPPPLWDYYPNVVLGVQIDHFWLTILRPHCCSLHTVAATGSIIWEVEGRGSGSKGVAHHTDSPSQDLGWWVCMICYPLTTTPPTFHSQIIPPVVAAYLPECHGDRALQGEIFSHVYPDFLLDFVLSSSFWGVSVTFFQVKSPC